MPTCLITGAGRGIGFGLAEQFALDGWSVLAGVRDEEASRRLERIDGDVTPIGLDVADPASVAILAERLRGLSIDMLVNNAGIFGPRGVGVGEIDFGAWQDVLTVNTLAPIRLTEALLDHLRAGEMRRVITISSIMGSMARNQGGNLIYRSSKAAVNGAMRTIAMDLAAEEFTVVVLHPGWVQTDMGGGGADIDTATSVTGLKRVIDRLTPADTGRFLNYDGAELPW